MWYLRFQRTSLLFLRNPNLRAWKWPVCLYTFEYLYFPTWVSFKGPSKEPHISFYPWSWLQRNSYDPPLNKDQIYNESVFSQQLFPFMLNWKNITSKVLWGSNIIKSPPTIDYKEVMTADGYGLFKWLSNVVSRWPHSPFILSTLSHYPIV